MNPPNLKSVALPILEIIGGTQKKLGSPWIRPRFLFSKIFNRLLFRLAVYMYPPNLKSVALPVPEIRGVAKLQTPNFGEGEAVGGRGWYRSKERW